MKKKNTPVFAVAAMAAVVAVLVYRATAVDTQTPPTPSVTPIPQDVPRPATPEKPEKATIYRLVEQKDHSFRLEPHVISVKDAKEPMVAALNAMAALSDSPLPSGTRVRAAQNDGNGLVTIDFNKTFLDNYPTGLEDQALAVEAILRTMAQFYGVEYVQFLVEGDKISADTHEDLSKPLSVRDGASGADASGADASGASEAGQ